MKKNNDEEEGRLFVRSIKLKYYVPWYYVTTTTTRRRRAAVMMREEERRERRDQNVSVKQPKINLKYEKTKS